tara:strand:- start:146 stop:736 length:591 start_codon:yes stop_codon:yes gene_type:complete
MFSGIIQGKGILKNFESNEILIETSLDLSDCKIGSSISCNGVCLTATSIKNINNNFTFTAKLSEETINKSNFSDKNLSNIINLERSLKVGDEISGHFVYGHVDCVSEISRIEKLESSWVFEIKKNQHIEGMQDLIVQKGSIAINGISLTVAKVNSNSFLISIIPHTFENTNLNKSKENDLVNIEFDALARYMIKNG